MPQNPPAAPASPNLPTFSDRLPDLTQVLRNSGQELAATKGNQTYIPYFEDVYAIAHSLKGVLGILECPELMAKFISAFHELLLRTLSGSSICRKNQEAGELFQELANVLDQALEAKDVNTEFLTSWLPRFEALFTEDVDHATRLKEVPAHLFYVNEFVSKKAREISLLNLNYCVVEDQARLDEIPLWRTNLQEALLSKEFGRGMVVNFLPFLSPEGSRTLNLWAWVAAASYSRASLKQRIKEVLPKVTITKL